jgi:nitrite reductase (NO-forming)
MTGTSNAASRGPHQWPKSALRIIFGLVWLIDAYLKWLPGFRSSYLDRLSGWADGQPSWLHGWFTFWINLQQPRVTFFAYLVAVVETLIALALIFGFARKVSYVAAIVFSLLIWSTAEGFGGPYTSGASDIGTAVIYAIVFAALLGFSYYEGTSRFSIDHYLERHVSWWHRLAEFGRPNHPKAAKAPKAPDAAVPASTTA